MREIARRIQGDDAPLGAWGDRELRGRAEEPPLN
jgi:hypothetical protein